MPVRGRGRSAEALESVIGSTNGVRCRSAARPRSAEAAYGDHGRCQFGAVRGAASGSGDGSMARIADANAHSGRTNERVTASAARCSPSRTMIDAVNLRPIFCIVSDRQASFNKFNRNKTLSLTTLIPPRYVRREWYYSKLARLGMYRKYRQVDFSTIDRLVFVCKGNICRSPYAESIATSIGCYATSCGIDALDGRCADNRAVTVAAERAVALGGHLTRSLEQVSLVPGDLVVLMEPEHVVSMRVREWSRGCQMSLLGLWHPEEQTRIFLTHTECRKTTFVDVSL